MDRQDIFKLGMVVIAAFFLLFLTKSAFSEIRDYGVDPLYNQQEVIGLTSPERILGEDTSRNGSVYDSG